MLQPLQARPEVVSTGNDFCLNLAVDRKIQGVGSASDAL
jgi:hypothetical protein